VDDELALYLDVGRVLRHERAVPPVSEPLLHQSLCAVRFPPNLRHSLPYSPTSNLRTSSALGVSDPDA